MSHDHKPTNKGKSFRNSLIRADFAEETARIQSAGGFVEFGRVNGKLWFARWIMRQN